MNRDFKGIWIPKEIWLSSELSLTEKVLLSEIDSLDNEEHCQAGNDYFANFFGCSESTITRAIKHLKDLGYIEELPFNGRIRKLRVVKLTRQNSQIDDHNNTYNNINIDNNTNVLLSSAAEQSLLIQEEPSNVEPKPKRKNLYQSCMDSINEFTDDIEVRNALREFLDIRLENREKRIGVKSFQGTLKKLRTLTDSKKECLQIIRQAIDRQYLTFYPLKTTVANVETKSSGTYTKVSTEEKEKVRKYGQKF